VNKLQKLRERYESRLDEAEKARAAYHSAIRGVHDSGIPLREIAEELGLSHQRIHQIVGSEAKKPPAGEKPARLRTST
jgi:predicted transcriptional regulator